MYLLIDTPRDIPLAGIKLAEFCRFIAQKHWVAMINSLRFCPETRKYVIFYSYILQQSG